MPTLRRSLRAVIVTLTFASASSGLAAQQLAPGTRVRVKSSDLVAPVIGNYQGMQRDTLLVFEEGEAGQRWAFSSATVNRLEVSDGMKSGNRGPMTRWALIGAGLGAATGLVAAAILEGSSDSEYSEALSAVVGAAIGAGAGAAYGYRVREERWTSVPIPRRVGLVPSRPGLRLAFRASF